MTTSRDPDREVAAWLADAGPPTLRQHVVEDALLHARSLGQRRSSLPWLGATPWPRPTQADGMGAVSLFVALVALAVAGMALLLAGGNYDRAVVSIGPAVTMPASVLPSPTATTRETSSPSSPIPLELRGTWTAVLPPRASLDVPASGHMRLSIGPDGARFDLPGIDDTGVLFASPWFDETTGELRLTADGRSMPFTSLRVDRSARGGCAIGAIGVYRWEVSRGSDGLADRLQLQLLHDQCSIFQALVPGTWVRDVSESPPPGP